MTTAVAVICTDGLVVGTDTKVTYGYGMKKPGAKLISCECLGSEKRSIVAAGAGSARHVRDALDALDLPRLEGTIGSSASFNEFLGRVLEVALPRFVSDYKVKYDKNPEFSLIIGCVEKGDPHGNPRLIQTYRDGDYDYEEDFSAIGTGSIFGEILLRKLYDKSLTVEVGKKIVAYTIWEVQGVDNNSGESMDIICVGKDGIAHRLSESEVEKLKELPNAMHDAYIDLRKKLESWGV